MNFTHPILLAVAAAVVAQGVEAQVRSTPSEVPSGVSMRITDVQGESVGFACEPFARVPNQISIVRGDAAAVDMYGLAKSPYILFAGAPSSSCYTIPWVLGGLTMEPPFVIIEVGMVLPTGQPNACGLDAVNTVLQVPVKVPSGVEVVLQTAAWPADLGMPAFSRGVKLFAK